MIKIVQVSPYKAILLSLALNCFACSDPGSVTADSLLDKTISAHGMDSMIGREIRFQFRDRGYSMVRDSNHYEYKRTTFQDQDTIVDGLHSDFGFNRLINGVPVRVADSLASKYSASVNSVLYFFQLPYVLNDPAVRNEYVGLSTIKNKEYHSLKITFEEEGGGEDFEDEFRYWINSETFEIDYMAYSYETDGGGIRFREAFNKRRIDGILFQDYRNFKPPTLATSLDSLPKLFERSELELLSTIENTDIIIQKAGEI